MTPGNPLDRQPEPFQGTMFSDGIDRIIGAGRIESACVGRQEGGNQHLVGSKEKNENCSHAAHSKQCLQLPADPGNVGADGVNSESTDVNLETGFKRKDHCYGHPAAMQLFQQRFLLPRKRFPEKAAKTVTPYGFVCTA
jgi:hypothetical protein